jgi:hypothetical protein
MYIITNNGNDISTGLKKPVNKPSPTTLQNSPLPKMATQVAILF